MLLHDISGGILTVHLTGEMDHSYAQMIRPELDDMLTDPKIKRLVLDLNGLEFMDSSGVGLLIGRYKILSRRGGSVAVRSVGSRVDRIFEMAGIYQIIDKLN